MSALEVLEAAVVDGDDLEAGPMTYQGRYRAFDDFGTAYGAALVAFEDSARNDGYLITSPALFHGMVAGRVLTLTLKAQVMFR